MPKAPVIGAVLFALTIGFTTVGRAAPVDADTLSMVEAFLKAPIERLPPEYMDKFLAVDPESLPKKLRRPFTVRKLEIYSLKQLAHRKKVGTVIMADDNCEVPREAKSAEITVMLSAGYKEITEEEKQWVGNRTKCTDRDMLCEFSLQIVDKKTVSGGKKSMLRRYFLYCKGASCDPLYILVGVYRAKVKDPNTPFFGISGPVCTR